jgi:hypothetical protein
LIDRHRLRAANLTLLTAVADRPYPYGHVTRVPWLKQYAQAA